MATPGYRASAFAVAPVSATEATAIADSHGRGNAAVHSLVFPFTLTLSHSLSHTHSRTRSLTLTCALALSHSLAHSLSHPPPPDVAVDGGGVWGECGAGAGHVQRGRGGHLRGEDEGTRGCCQNTHWVRRPLTEFDLMATRRVAYPGVEPLCTVFATTFGGHRHDVATHTHTHKLNNLIPSLSLSHSPPSLPPPSDATRAPRCACRKRRPTTARPRLSAWRRPRCP